MALPSIPSLSNLPSYSGADSSLNRGAASSLLGSGTPSVSTGAGNAFMQNTMANTGLTNVADSLKSQSDTIKSSLAGQTITNPNFVNPLANLVSKNSTEIASSLNDAMNNTSMVSNAISKSNLDSVVGQLSGGVGSGLNGLTSALPSAGGLNVGSVAGVAGSAGSALGGIGSVATKAIGGVADTLKSVTGSISNVTADISGSLNKLTGGNLAGGVQESLRSVSAMAGQANNILSIFRGKNIPAGGELFKQQGTPIELSSSVANDWRIRINCNFDIFGSQLFGVLKETGGVVWPYLPSVNVSTKANYTQTDTVHSNYPYQTYKNSQVDEITIDGEFTCETERDAAYWIAAVTFFKTATKMFYGQGEYAGNPPIVCNLTGYGASIFDKVPVVIKSFSVNLNDNVDYINCNKFGTNTWVPVLSSVSVTVMPIYNRARQRKFSLKDYANGSVAKGVGYI